MTSLSLGVVFIASLSWLGLGQVSGQISRINVFGNLSDRPEKTSRALNYLVVGSDTREGLTKAQIKALRVGSTAVAAGGRSDTMLLVHISKARDAAYIVSIPRDTFVTIPAHRSQDGTRVAGVRTFAASGLLGGLCGLLSPIAPGVAMAIALAFMAIIWVSPFAWLFGNAFDNQALGRLGWPLARLKTEVFRLRQKFRDQVRQEVALTVETPHEIEMEMAHLHLVLSDPSA